MANVERGFFGGLIGRFGRRGEDVQSEIVEDQIEIQPGNLNDEPQPQAESKDDVFARLNYDERVALADYIKGRAEGELADDRLENVSNYAQLLVDEETGDVYIPKELDDLSRDLGYGAEDLVFFSSTDNGFEHNGPVLPRNEEAKEKEGEKLSVGSDNVVHFPVELGEGKKVELDIAAGDD